MQHFGNYILKPVLGAAAQAEREKAIAFWRKEGMLLNGEVLARRAQQIVVVALNDKDEVVGVSTAVKSRIKLLNDNNLYRIRHAISLSKQWPKLRFELIRASLDILEKSAAEEPEPCIGAIVIKNSPAMSGAFWNDAFWPDTDMHFAGFANDEAPFWVKYFRGSKI